MELRTPKHDVFEDEVLKIDFSEQSAVLEGKVIDFTPKEYRTLFLFVKKKSYKPNDVWKTNFQ
jgi:DNA-binding response OmpR family regulator